MIKDAIEDATRTGSSIDLFLNGYRLAERKGGTMIEQEDNDELTAGCYDTKKAYEQRLAAAESKLLMSNALPKITDEIYNDYGFDVFIELIDGKPQWTQAAIDFAALLDEMKGKIESRKGE